MIFKTTFTLNWHPSLVIIYWIPAGNSLLYLRHDASQARQPHHSPACSLFTAARRRLTVCALAASLWAWPVGAAGQGLFFFLDMNFVTSGSEALKDPSSPTVQIKYLHAWPCRFLSPLRRQWCVFIPTGRNKLKLRWLLSHQSRIVPLKFTSCVTLDKSLICSLLFQFSHL